VVEAAGAPRGRFFAFPANVNVIVLADVLKVPEVAEAVSHAGRPDIEH
jgi:hypothetical protein